MLQRCSNRTNCCWLLVILMADALVVMANPQAASAGCVCCFGSNGQCRECSNTSGKPCQCTRVGFSCYPRDQIDPPPEPEPSRCNCCYDNPTGTCKVCNTPADYPCSCKPIGFSTRCEQNVDQIKPEIKPEPSRCKCCYENRTKRCKVCNTPADYPCSCRLNFLTPSDPSTLCVPEL